MVLDSREKGEQLKKHLADLRKKWLDSGRKMRVEKIRDVEFSVIALTSAVCGSTSATSTAVASPSATVVVV